MKTDKDQIENQKLRMDLVMMVRAHIIVSGRVQGVFFRSETSYEAEKRGVKGWVRNLSNGRVEAVFEGEENSVKELVKFCRRGPTGARVSKVDVEWESYISEFRNFKIIDGHGF